MELSVEQAQVSIKVVKIGNKSMTKAVFRQIPTVYSFAEEDIVFGYINELREDAYLINRNGVLLKMRMDLAPTEPLSFEEESKSSRLLSKEEYEKWVKSYMKFYNKVKGAQKLYMAT